jgi:hypothetical protein
MPRINKPKCCSFLVSNKLVLCNASGKNVLDNMFYCGKHIEKATKTYENPDDWIFVELEKLTDTKNLICDDDDCAICGDPYTKAKPKSILPCGHAFHVKCVGEWFIMGRYTCPYCRQKTILPTRTITMDERFMTWVGFAARVGGTKAEPIIRKWIMERKLDYMNCKTAKEKMEFKISEKEKMDELIALILIARNE